jgi:hypothetical protein
VSFFICVERFVDSDLSCDPCGFGHQADEAFGVDAIGSIESKPVSKMLYRMVAEDERRDSNHRNK